MMKKKINSLRFFHTITPQCICGGVYTWQIATIQESIYSTGYFYTTSQHTVMITAQIVLAHVIAHLQNLELMLHCIIK